MFACSLDHRGLFYISWKIIHGLHFESLSSNVINFIMLKEKIFELA